MSYNIIKNIRKTNEGVYLTYADSSLTDDNGNYVIYPESKNEYFSEIYLNEGNEEFLKAILMEFWSGNFQGSYGGYSQFVDYLKTIDKDSEFNYHRKNYNREKYDNKKLLGDYLFTNYKQFLQDKKTKCVLRVIVEGKQFGYYVQNSKLINMLLLRAKVFTLPAALKEIKKYNEGTVEIVVLKQ
jgi:hypothetical protein